MWRSSSVMWQLPAGRTCWSVQSSATRAMSTGGHRPSLSSTWASHKPTHSPSANKPDTPPGPALRGPEFDARRRLFYPRDIYNPADLSQVAPPLSSPLRQGQRLITLQPLSLLGVRDPRENYKDSELLSLYINEMGMIRGRKETGLTRRMQARMAKAIRRARCLGFLPFTFNPYSPQ